MGLYCNLQYHITVVWVHPFSGVPGSTMYNSVRVMVCGRVGEAPVPIEKRLNLFSYSGEVTIADDEGTAVSDYPMQLYAEVVKHFTNPFDWVVFTSLCSGM